MSGRVSPGTVPLWLATHATLTACAADTCLPWPFGVDKGYGMMRHDGRTRHAHTVACEQAHGPAPVGRPQAAHSCGNRSCVNPHHLRWASAKENAADQILHGTRRAGATHHLSRLSAEAVATIRANPDGLSCAQLAAQFDCAYTTIYDIQRGKRRASS